MENTSKRKDVKPITFPLKFSPKLHSLVTKAAFVNNISKHQWCLDTLYVAAKEESKKLIIKEGD